MSSPVIQFKQKLTDFIRDCEKNGLPGRNALLDTAKALQSWKQKNNLKGLWSISPLFLTATLDDAWGHGLDLIESYARVLGLRVVRLGLLMSAEEVIASCRKMKPDYLGMTVLQFDSEEDLCQVGCHLPEKTELIVGGPIFKADPDIAANAHVRFVAKDITDFVTFFLSRISIP